MAAAAWRKFSGRTFKRLGLAGKAWLTGRQRDMPQVMNAIDCLVHPQIGTEALGLVICEAHACGKPVIASALDGIPEAFGAGQYGRLVPPENIAELAGAMEAQAAEPALSAAQATALHDKVGARLFPRTFSANEVLRLYADLLSRPQDCGRRGPEGGQPIVWFVGAREFGQIAPNYGLTPMPDLLRFEMKMKIRLDFCDFWPGFPKADNFFYQVLRERFDVRICDRPDFLIFKEIGQHLHRVHNCVKIHFCTENAAPDFNLCDYALTCREI